MKSANHMDYSGFFGRNLIDDAAEANAPFRTPPKDAKDYAIYRGYWEGEIQKTVGQLNGCTPDQGLFKASAQCEAVNPKTGNVVKCQPPKEGHMGAGFVAACNHIIVQDPVNPEGAHFLPYQRGGADGYFVCSTCFKLMEQRKFDLSEQVMCKCVKCILEALTEIKMKRPDRFFDHRMD